MDKEAKFLLFYWVSVVALLIGCYLKRIGIVTTYFMFTILTGLWGLYYQFFL